jgi:hypothetical protein
MSRLLAHERRLIEEQRPWALEAVEEVFEALDALDNEFAKRPAFRAWVIREYRRGHVQDWMAARQRSVVDKAYPNPGDSPVASRGLAFRHIAQAARVFDWLQRHNKPVPDFQRYEWAELVSIIPDVDEFLPNWRQRKVLYQYADGWTMEQVTQADDLELEGELMGNCASVLSVRSNQTLLSLRNPDGYPRVSVYATEGVVTDILGRGHRLFPQKYAPRILEYFKSLPHRTTATWCEQAGSDEYGLYAQDMKDDTK